MYAGNRSVARLIKSGDCKLCVLGDSIFGNGIVGGVAACVTRRWRPDRWVGLVSGYSGQPDWGASFYHMTVAFAANSLIALSDGTGKTPKSMAVSTFNGGTSPAEAAWWSDEFQQDSFQILGRTFFNLDTWYEKALNVRSLFYGSGSASFNGMIRISLERETNQQLQTTNAANLSLTNGALVTVNTTYAAGAGRPQMRILAPISTVMTNGKVAEYMGSRWYTGESGFQFDVLIQAGGYVAETYTSNTNVSVTNWNSYHAAMGTNVFYINVGANNSETKAAYKQNVLDLMAKCLGANASAKFVLAPCHELTDVTLLNQKADAMYEIAASRTDSLFINTQKALGSYDYLRTNYTYASAPAAEQQLGLADGDHVHPNHRLSMMIADVSWELIEQAAAPASRVVTYSGSGVTVKEVANV